MVILIEFNELTPSLLQRFMDDGTLPNFKRLYDRSAVFSTVATDEQLNPWVQWPTIHAGVPASQHGIAHTGDGSLNLAYQCVGTVLSDAGVRVGIFGSMNLNYGALNGYMIPDPWDKRGTAYPQYLNAFYSIISEQVKDSSRYITSKKQLIALGTFLIRNGMTGSTVRKIFSQLLQERTDRGIRWRRAMLLDHISYDLFRTLNRRYNVEFATFFSNSTAHFQHYYWRDMDPSSFETARGSAHPSLAEAVHIGYMSMDGLIGRMFADYPGATLIFCTGLSQGPRLIGDLYYYRISDYDAFLKFFKLDAQTYRITPVMSAEFHIHCPSVADAQAVMQTLDACRVDDAPVFNLKPEGDKLVVSVKGTQDSSALDETLHHPDGRTIRFGNMAHLLEGSASGTHRREGALWIGTGTRKIFNEPVDLTDIAPTILGLFNLAPPSYMKGRNLLARARSEVHSVTFAPISTAGRS